jgi:hypothetical protein
MLSMGDDEAIHTIRYLQAVSSTAILLIPVDSDKGVETVTFRMILSLLAKF